MRVLLPEKNLNDQASSTPMVGPSFHALNQINIFPEATIDYLLEAKPGLISKMASIGGNLKS